MGDSGNLRVLLGDSLRRVDHDNCDITALHSRYSPDDAVPLQVLLYLALSPKTRGINEGIILPVPGNNRVDRISCGACDIRYNDPVTAEQFIDYRGLSDIRLPDNGNSGILVLLRRLCSLWELRNHRIEKIPKSLLSFRRNRIRFSYTKVIELIYIHLLCLEAVHLIHGKHNRLPALAQHGGDLIIRVCQSLTDVGHKNDHISGVDGDHRLFSHLREDHVAAVRLDSTGINHRKLMREPADIGIDPVPGHSGRILHNGDSLSRKSIK